MRALTVEPMKQGSAALRDVAEPGETSGGVVVSTMMVGICGTDEEIVGGRYGWAPSGRDRLILGHESLGRVAEAPAGSGLAKGDLVVGIVRRPDPVPCPSCAVGEWDMCRNGRYTERGIKQLDGYASELYRIEPAYTVKVDSSLGDLGVLLEPTSVVAKAWDQIDRIGARAAWQPERALITGAGPIGLLAALLARQRGLEVHVLDQVTGGPKPDLVAGLGATYHVGDLEKACRDPDVIVECTGAPSLVFGAIEHVGPGGVVCLTGVSSGGRHLSIDPGLVNRNMVLENTVVFGSVNANRRHYEAAGTALAKADRSWLDGLITRRVPLADWEQALARRDGDVKVALQIGQG